MTKAICNNYNLSLLFGQIYTNEGVQMLYIYKYITFTCIKYNFVSKKCSYYLLILSHGMLKC